MPGPLAVGLAIYAALLWRWPQAWLALLPLLLPLVDPPTTPGGPGAGEGELQDGAGRRRPPHRPARATHRCARGLGRFARPGKSARRGRGLHRPRAVGARGMNSWRHSRGAALFSPTVMGNRSVTRPWTLSPVHTGSRPRATMRRG